MNTAPYKLEAKEIDARIRDIPFNIATPETLDEAKTIVANGEADVLAGFLRGYRSKKQVVGARAAKSKDVQSMLAAGDVTAAQSFIQDKIDSFVFGTLERAASGTGAQRGARKEVANAAATLAAKVNEIPTDLQAQLQALGFDLGALSTIATALESKPRKPKTDAPATENGENGETETPAVG